MIRSKRTLRTCENGHHYYKSSDCLVCPYCENKKKPQVGFLSILSAPARRALEQEGITTLRRLSESSEQELLQLHGFGKSSIPKLRQALAAGGLTFKKQTGHNN